MYKLSLKHFSCIDLAVPWADVEFTCVSLIHLPGRPMIMRRLGVTQMVKIRIIIYLFIKIQLCMSTPRFSNLFLFLVFN